MSVSAFISTDYGLWYCLHLQFTHSFICYVQWTAGRTLALHWGLNGHSRVHTHGALIHSLTVLSTVYMCRHTQALNMMMFCSYTEDRELDRVMFVSNLPPSADEQSLGALFPNAVIHVPRNDKGDNIGWDTWRGNKAALADPIAVVVGSAWQPHGVWFESLEPTDDLHIFYWSEIWMQNFLCEPD